MKYIRKFNNNLDCQNYINNNAIDPALYEINDNVKYINKAGNYIQDGLIFQLDGNYKGFYNNVMTDLISGKHIDIEKEGDSSKFEYEYSKEYLKLTNLYNAWGKMIFDTDIPQNQNYTVEVCLLLVNTGRKFVFSSGSNFTPMFVINNELICFMQRSKQYYYNKFTTNTKYTFSLNLDHGYCNNIELIQKGDDYWNLGESNIMYFFNGKAGGSKNCPPIGNIYAIRIYNRRLTPEEQLHNQNIDIKRFNITI